MAKVIKLREPDPFEAIVERCETIKRLALSLSAQDERESPLFSPEKPEPEGPTLSSSRTAGRVIPFRMSRTHPDP